MMIKDTSRGAKAFAHCHTPTSRKNGEKWGTPISIDGKVELERANEAADLAQRLVQVLS